MKVYTKVTIDMRTLEVVNEESFDYLGPVTECKGGGGGSSGQVGFPTYMEDIHHNWLDGYTGFDPSYGSIDLSMIEAMNNALGNSPYVSATAYDPDTDLDAMDTAIEAFNTVVDAIAVEDDYATYSDAVQTQVDSVISTTYIDAEIAAYGAVLDAEYDDDLAKLQSGARDIGVSMSSGFTIAGADLLAKKERALTEFGSKLYVELERHRNDMITQGVQLVFQAHLQRVQFEGDVARMTADANRIRIVAKGEQTREDYGYDEKDGKWDAEVFQYAANLMAAPSGGTALPGDTSHRMSTGQSVLSGAMSGAAIGTMIKPGMGTGIGAGVGALAGLLM